MTFAARLIPRRDWGARAPRYVNRGSMTAAPTGHWNGPDVLVRGALDWAHEDCFPIVRGIQNYHMDGRRWSDIAYNYVPCHHGYVFEGRGLNVWNGANGTTTGNRTSHAIMWPAGLGNPLTEEAKRAFRETVAWLAQEAGSPDRAQGHRDHKSTACPGDDRYSWIHAGMPLPRPTPLPPLEDDEMQTFLFRTTKSMHVWLVAGNLMTKRWVAGPTYLGGYQELLAANGLSPDVCHLDSTTAMAQAIMDIPAEGPVPGDYTGPVR